MGGLLSAGIGGAISRGNGRWIGVPVGAATGALLGCQVDGG
ncbi:MAG: glycine zipper 2TM domain-containing protein [Prochlorococcus sp.]